MSTMNIIILEKDGSLKMFDAFHIRYIPSLIQCLHKNMETAKDILEAINNAPFPWSFGYYMQGEYIPNTRDPDTYIFDIEKNNQNIENFHYEYIFDKTDYKAPPIQIGIEWEVENVIFIDVIHKKVIQMTFDGGNCGRITDKDTYRKIYRDDLKGKRCVFKAHYPTEFEFYDVDLKYFEDKKTREKQFRTFITSLATKGKIFDTIGNKLHANYITA